MPDQHRSAKELLEDIEDFLKNERRWFGDWQSSTSPLQSSANDLEIVNKNTPDSKKAQNTVALDEISNPRDTIAGKETIQPKNDQSDTPETKPTSILTLENCKTLDELRTVCESADDLRTDLEGTNLVFGVGNPEADLLLVGEAPGVNEDEQGEPFVGRAGKLLNQILEAINFSRDDIYIANILKHRPPENRNPNAEERKKSLPYLLKQIDIIQPKLILCLGRVSGTTLLDNDDSLKNLRGAFHPFSGAELMVTYHPAALLRNPNWKRPTWEDVQRLRERYDELGCTP